MDDGDGGRQSVGKGNELLLFSLNGVGWSHVVTGDVTFLSGVDGASLPPVAFPEERSKLEIRNAQYRHKGRRGKYGCSEKKTAGVQVSEERKGTRSHCASFNHVSYPSQHIRGADK